ncbi:MAG: 5-carboxymethyl-2-hydroxymuconate isomerase [Macromonas sp.]
MPHLVIYYTSNLDRETDMTVLCRHLADTMLAVRDENGLSVFPRGGVRVLAYPAPHYAVSDGGTAGRSANTHSGAASGDAGDYAFVYLNLRMGRGRTGITHQTVGQALTQATHAHFAELFQRRHIGITLQIDEGPEVFDAKHSNIHPLFAPVSTT